MGHAAASPQHTDSPIQLTPQPWWQTLATFPVLWGAILTYGFYQAIPYIPVRQPLIQRYFCSHPLEYAIAALFFTGVAIVLLKLMGLMSQAAVFRRDPLPPALLQPVKTAEELTQVTADEWRRLPRHLQRTHLGQRLADVVAWLRGRGNTQGLEEHLKYLGEQADDRLHDSYGLLRTINWAVPIIGFLGTVVGITLAIANVTPEQLDTSLSAVTGGLAVAFDTTALSLALTLVLVFAYFLVERSEQRILARVEDYSVKRIACACPATASLTQETFFPGEGMGQHLLEHTEEMLQAQMQLWQSSIDSLRTRWQETVEQQQQNLATSLQAGMSQSLHDHASQLGQIRSEFLSAFRDVSEQLAQTVRDFQSTTAADRADQTRQWHSSLEGLQTAFNELRTDLATQVQELRDQKTLLTEVVGQEQELQRLQNSLAENLQLLRSSGSFDETLHSLSAAVHLLTARTRSAA